MYSHSIRMILQWILAANEWESVILTVTKSSSSTGFNITIPSILICDQIHFILRFNLKKRKLSIEDTCCRQHWLLLPVLGNVIKLILPKTSCRCEVGDVTQLRFWSIQHPPLPPPPWYNRTELGEKLLPISAILGPECSWENKRSTEHACGTSVLLALSF